ncbi:MAG: sulfurtransferase [Rhodothermales bacterium]|nr:sulfurtransferase [Rhodothermales bacterium]
MTYSTLITADALGRQRDDSWVLLDCRFELTDIEAGHRDYLTGHLEGAHYAHLDRDLSGPIEPGVTGRHPLPDSMRFRTLVASWGITPDTQVVAYDQGHGAFAARAWWLLRYHGHAKVAVLNGGLAAAREAGLPLSKAVPVRATGTYPNADPLVRATVADDILGSLAEGTAPALVDARANERYRGLVEPLDPVAGHIPTARNRHFQANLDDSGRFRPADDLRADFLAFGLPEKQVHYCGSGVTAAHNLLAMEAAGLSGASLYPGSWSEWITDPSRPVESEG